MARSLWSSLRAQNEAFLAIEAAKSIFADARTVPQEQDVQSSIAIPRTSCRELAKTESQMLVGVSNADVTLNASILL
jgi:hypothetical protein